MLMLLPASWTIRTARWESVPTSPTRTARRTLESMAKSSWAQALTDIVEAGGDISLSRNVRHRCPVLLITGSECRWTRLVRELAAAIPQGSSSRRPEPGHDIHVSHPTGWCRRSSTGLRTTSDARAGAVRRWFWGALVCAWSASCAGVVPRYGSSIRVHPTASVDVLTIRDSRTRQRLLQVVYRPRPVVVRRTASGGAGPLGGERASPASTASATDHASVYGMRPADWHSQGIRLLGRTAVECTRDVLVEAIAGDVARVVASAVTPHPLPRLRRSTRSSAWATPCTGSEPGARRAGQDTLDRDVFRALTRHNLMIVASPIEVANVDYAVALPVASHLAEPSSCSLHPRGAMRSIRVAGLDPGPRHRPSPRPSSNSWTASRPPHCSSPSRSSSALTRSHLPSSIHAAGGTILANGQVDRAGGLRLIQPLATQVVIEVDRRIASRVFFSLFPRDFNPELEQLHPHLLEVRRRRPRRCSSRPPGEASASVRAPMRTLYPRPFVLHPPHHR